MGKRLYVGNLPFTSDEATLRAAFEQDGRKVASIHIVMDRETGRPRGFAFVEMATDEDALAAIQAVDGADVGGRKLRVNEAEDRRPGGGGGPRPGGPRPPREARIGGGGPAPGGGGPPGGGAGPRWREDDAKRAKADKAKPRRKDDVSDNYGGRRGTRRFDDEDDEEF